MQFSVAVRNGRLDVIETILGTSARLMMFTGDDPPASCSAADEGVLLVTIVLPSDYMAAASNGSKNKTATAWTATVLVTGTAGHFRFKDSTETTTHIQGRISVVGGTGHLWLDSTSLVSGQPVAVSTCVWTEGGA